jgi:hypothetical protein
LPDDADDRVGSQSDREDAELAAREDMRDNRGDEYIGKTEK